MKMQLMVSVVKWTGRLGKLGLFMTIAVAFGTDMLTKEFGGPVDEKALVAAAMPYLVLFAVLGAGGDIAFRFISDAAKG
jgi:hypothetical protein